MTTILNEDFNRLVEEYDSTYKDIVKTQKVLEGYFSNMWQGMVKTHKDWGNKVKVSRFMKGMDDAMKADDNTINKALPIVQRALQNKEKKLLDIENKIKGSKLDPALLAPITKAMDDNKAQVKKFNDSLKALTDSLAKSGVTSAAPTPAPSPSPAPAAPAPSPSPTPAPSPAPKVTPGTATPPTSGPGTSSASTAPVTPPAFSGGPGGTAVATAPSPSPSTPTPPSPSATVTSTSMSALPPAPAPVAAPAPLPAPVVPPTPAAPKTTVPPPAPSAPNNFATTLPVRNPRSLAAITNAPNIPSSIPGPNPGRSATSGLAPNKNAIIQRTIPSTRSSRIPTIGRPPAPPTPPPATGSTSPTSPTPPTPPPATGSTPPTPPVDPATDAANLVNQVHNGFAGSVPSGRADVLDHLYDTPAPAATPASKPTRARGPRGSKASKAPANRPANRPVNMAAPEGTPPAPKGYTDGPSNDNDQNVDYQGLPPGAEPFNPPPEEPKPAPSLGTSPADQSIRTSSVPKSPADTPPAKTPPAKGPSLSQHVGNVANTLGKAGSIAGDEFKDAGKQAWDFAKNPSKLVKKPKLPSDDGKDLMREALKKFNNMKASGLTEDNNLLNAIAYLSSTGMPMTEVLSKIRSKGIPINEKIVSLVRIANK